MEAGCNNIKPQGVLLNGYTRELGKVMITPVGAHDSTQEYDVLSLTYDANTRVSYISRKSVPAGTSLSDRNYWQPMNTNGAGSQTQEELKALIEPIITDVITDGRYATDSEIDNKIAEALEGVQGSLTFDDVPTANSDNPVKSSGIKDYVDSHQVTTDAAPTQGSSNPVSSGGVYTALQGKQDTISDLNEIRIQAREFSNSPAAGITSTNINSWNQAAEGGGTITGITMNGSSKGTSGVVDLGTVVTQETDPTVPQWAKQSAPPTPSEIGAYTKQETDSAIQAAINSALANAVFWGDDVGTATVTENTEEPIENSEPVEEPTEP